jgi:predicted polyphosphate/ATP-dependent NAD kinase
MVFTIQKFLEVNIVLDAQKRKLGLIVNPIAGMGGRVGLKGTDGKAILCKAMMLGAKPVAPIRSEVALNVLAKVKDAIQIVTYPYDMGENEAKKCGFNPIIIGSITPGRTTEKDTQLAVAEMLAQKVELILFVGGDGTARDVYEAADKKVPVLGVPAGVKIHSAVFAVDPIAAAKTAKKFLLEGLPVREMEVMDVDEEAFREGRVSAKLYGYVLVPYEPMLIQRTKTASPLTEMEIRNQAALAIYIIEEMELDTVYIVGPGTTTRTIGDLLEEEKTLLGVDLFWNKRIIAKDVNETEIWRVIDGKEARIIVTPIGGQGFIFGRGNQQISSAIIRKVGLQNIIVIATKHKLRGLKGLKVDTGDSKLDQEFHGYIKVVTDYREEHMIQII